MNDLEAKRKRIETIAKVGLLGVAGFFFAPVAYLTITGIISLLVVGVIALLVVNIGIPWLSTSIANWRLKALKAVAAANPIETLENQYAEKQESILKARDNIKQFQSVVNELWEQIKAHNEAYPNRPSQFLDRYNKMKALLELRANRYKQARVNLEAFAKLIEEKRSDWKVAQSAAKALKLANVGEDFQSKLMQDTALTTIQDGLNFAFSELDVSLLDEDPAKVDAKTTTVVEVSPSVTPLQLAEKAGPPSLDLGFEPEEVVEAVPVSRSNRR